MRQIQLAVLLCDELIRHSPTITAAHGNYAQICHQFLTASLARVASEVTFTLDAYIVYQMEYPPDDAGYDAILISGSLRAAPTDPLPWIQKLIAYVRHIITEKPSVKVFGICFGHEIVALALGGQVGLGKLEISVTNIRLTSIGRAIFRAHELNLHEIHHREVTRAPAHAHLLGSSNDVHNQGMVILDPASASLQADLDSNALSIDLTSIQVLTLQGHPELTEPIMRKLIIQTADKMPRDVVEDALSRAGLSTNGIDKVGRALWGVLGVKLRC